MHANLCINYLFQKILIIQPQSYVCEVIRGDKDECSLLSSLWKLEYYSVNASCNELQYVYHIIRGICHTTFPLASPAKAICILTEMAVICLLGESEGFVLIILHWYTKQLQCLLCRVCHSLSLHHIAIYLYLWLNIKLFLDICLVFVLQCFEPPVLRQLTGIIWCNL